MSVVYQSQVATLRQECISTLLHLVKRKIEEIRQVGPSVVLEQLEQSIYELTYCYLNNDASRSYHVFMTVQDLL